MAGKASPDRRAPQGAGPYVFVCYAHADAEEVSGEIRWLQARALQAWYDAGIAPGEEWSEELGRAISNADAVLFFVTPRSVASRHCRNEIHFAQKHGKPILAIHLQSTELPPGLELILGANQAILAHQDPDGYRERLHSALLKLGILPPVDPPSQSRDDGNGADRRAGADPDEALIAAELAHLLDEPTFVNAPRLRDLLRYIVQHTLSGAAGELKEYAIGVEVFGRGDDFDPRTDTIVRVQVRRLRARLKAYYEAEGRARPWRVRIPKGRYRAEFSRHVEPTQAPSRQRPRRSRLPIAWLTVAASATLALAVSVILLLRPTSPLPVDAGVSVAVLPFEDLTPARDQGYLAYGLADELRDAVGSLPGVQVLGRQSSISVLADPAGALAEELGIDLVVRGELRAKADGLELSVDLIGVGSDRVIAQWQSEGSAGELASAYGGLYAFVQRHLRPESDGPGVADGETLRMAGHDIGARDLILLARHYETQARGQAIPDPALLDRFTALYRDAVRLEPDSPLAQSRLAGALIYQGQLGAAKPFMYKALELNPDISEVQETFGRFLFLSRLPGSGAAWQRAVELNPNNADALSSYAYWLWMQRLGEFEEAQRLWRRALELDPLSLARHADLGNFYGMMGWRDQTIEVAQRITTTFDGVAAYQAVARLYELAGEVDVAIAWSLAAHQQNPDNPELAWQLAELFAVAGDFSNARRLEPDPGIGAMFLARDYDALIDAAEMLLLGGTQYLDVQYKLAFAYNAVGRYEEAADLLEEARVRETASSESKQADSVEAYLSLADALYGSGDLEAARQLAEARSAVRPSYDADIWRDWWYAWVNSCGLSLLERHDEALEVLARIEHSPRLIWQPYLLDAPCMRRLHHRPEFESVLAGVEARRAAIRQRLPDTLARHHLKLAQGR